MRLLFLFKKALIENFRDWKIIILGLTFAPFFVVIMYFYFGETVKTYDVIIVSHDQGYAIDGRTFLALQTLISDLKDIKNPDGSEVMRIEMMTDLEEAKKRLGAKDADLVVEIPENLSEILQAYSAGEQPPPAVIKTHGSPSSMDSIMAAAWSDAIIYQYALAFTGQKIPLEIQAEGFEQMRATSDFDLYVPGLIALALMMLMFTAAASLIKEKDKGTLVRLRMSYMTTFEWLAAVSVTQVIIGLLAMGLTLLTAMIFGYRPMGSLFGFLVIGFISSLSIMAISVVVAASLRTIFDLMTIGCFPFFLLMFFSGGMFPLPTMKLFSLAGHPFQVNDILPTSHSISALSKILNGKAGLADVAFEIGAIVFLTLVYFSVGIWLFSRRHMRAQ
jgi:ABC-2 type transport system permease protein